MPDNMTRRIAMLKQMVEAHFPQLKEPSQTSNDIDKIIADFADSDSLYSNDQLLNAIYLLLNSEARYGDIEESVVSPIG